MIITSDMPILIAIFINGLMLAGVLLVVLLLFSLFCLPFVWVANELQENTRYYKIIYYELTSKHYSIIKSNSEIKAIYKFYKYHNSMCRIIEIEELQ